MRPAFLSALGWLLLVPALYASAFQWITLRKLRDAWRGPDALTGTLDRSLACDLVSDFIAKDENRRHVKCEGALTVLGDGGGASLSGVQVDWEQRTYCLARAPHWTVLRVVRSMPCFATPPPDLAHPIESERERVQLTATARMGDQLAGIRTAMTSDVRPATCPPRTRDQHGAEVPVLEYELLQGGVGDPAWSFLSTSWLRAAVVAEKESGPALKDALLDASERWAPELPWVAVVTSQSRTEPRAGLALKPWTRGQLSGTLALVDAAKGELLCEVPFSFKSSDTLERPRPSSYKSRLNIAPIFDIETDDRIQADFKRRYDSEATRVLNVMSSYGVRPSMH